MARTFTLTELITLAKQYSDQENDSFISDAEWRGYISSGYSHLYSVLVESGMRYFESEDTYTVSGTPWSLPSDFLTAIGVDYLLDGTSTGRRVQLQELMAQERNIYSGLSSSGTATRYEFAGSTINLRPAPVSGQVYALVYVPQPTQLATDGTDDANNIDVVTPDGEQFVIWNAVLLARDKEGADVRSALRARGEAMDRITFWAQQRSLHSSRTPQVQQEFNSYDHDPGDWWWRR